MDEAEEVLGEAAPVEAALDVGTCGPLGYRKALMQCVFNAFKTRHCPNNTCLPALRNSCALAEEWRLTDPTNWMTQRSEDRECDAFEEGTQRYLVPLLIVLSSLGNSGNLLVYRLPYFTDSTAVHLLRLKAWANLGFTAALVPGCLHAWLPRLMGAGSAGDVADAAFWHSQPYVLFLLNAFGSLNTWATTAVTLETLLCVAAPLLFRRANRSRYSSAFIWLALVGAAGLQMAFPLLRKVAVFPAVSQGRCVRQRALTLRPLGSDAASQLYERLYFWCHAVLVIMLPLATMLVAAVAIGAKFRDRDLGEAMSARRRTVVRLTFATAISHLLLEGPGLFIVAAAALDSSRRETFLAGCLVPAVSNLLAVLNAAIPFLIFATFSHNFRGLARSLFGGEKAAATRPSTLRSRALSEAHVQQLRSKVSRRGRTASHPSPTKAKAQPLTNPNLPLQGLRLPDSEAANPLLSTSLETKEEWC